MASVQNSAPSASELSNELTNEYIKELKEKNKKLNKIKLLIHDKEVDKKYGSDDEQPEINPPKDLKGLVQEINNINEQIRQAVKELHRLEINRHERDDADYGLLDNADGEAPLREQSGRRTRIAPDSGISSTSSAVLQTPDSGMISSRSSEVWESLITEETEEPAERHLPDGFKYPEATNPRTNTKYLDDLPHTAIVLDSAPQSGEPGATGPSNAALNDRMDNIRDNPQSSSSSSGASTITDLHDPDALIPQMNREPDEHEEESPSNDGC